MKGTILLNAKDLDTGHTGIEVNVELEQANTLDKMMCAKFFLRALLADPAELDLFNIMVSCDFWPDGRTLAEDIAAKVVQGNEN